MLSPFPLSIAGVSEYLVIIPHDHGIPHAQRRVVPRTGRILVLTSPAGFEGFFRELAEADRAGVIGPDSYARASKNYGITWAG